MVDLWVRRLVSVLVQNCPHLAPLLGSDLALLLMVPQWVRQSAVGDSLKHESHQLLHSLLKHSPHFELYLQTHEYVFDLIRPPLHS